MKGEFFKWLKDRNSSQKKTCVRKNYEGKSSQLLPLLVSVQDWIFL